MFEHGQRITRGHQTPSGERTGETRAEALRKLHDLCGANWTPRSQENLADALKRVGTVAAAVTEEPAKGVKPVVAKDGLVVHVPTEGAAEGPSGGESSGVDALTVLAACVLGGLLVLVLLGFVRRRART